MSWVSIGAVWGFVGVALGAFGAHALRRVASPEQLTWWTTATHYHLTHALAVVAVGLVQVHRPAVGAAGWPLIAGSIVFSGTLYAMSLGGPRWLGAVTPIGGLAMLAGWLLLAWHAYGLVGR